jgi:hypothetical protein
MVAVHMLLIDLEAWIGIVSLVRPDAGSVCSAVLEQTVVAQLLTTA